MSSSGVNVPVGTATVAGYSVTVLAGVGAVLTLILPDVDQQQIALIASTIVSFGAFVVTQVGRFQQAKALAAKPAPITVGSNTTALAGSYDALGNRVTPLLPYGTETPGEPVDVPAPEDPEG